MAFHPIYLIAQSAAHAAIPVVLSGIISALPGFSHGLAVQVVDPADPKALGDLGKSLLDVITFGAILMPGLSGEEHLAQTIVAAGSTYVRIAPDGRESAANLVCSNDRLGMRDATNYLISMGHRRIGFISISDDSRTARERELGFMDAMAEHRLDMGAELVVPADDTVKGGRDAALLLFAVSPRPTAILASSDIQAAGVLQAAHQQVIPVPAALSVMGFGDGEVAMALSPPLTTMRVPYMEMGFTAAVKLLDPARADALPVEFFCELTPRGSTGPIAA